MPNNPETTQFVPIADISTQAPASPVSIEKSAKTPNKQNTTKTSVPSTPKQSTPNKKTTEEEKYRQAVNDAYATLQKCYYADRTTYAAKEQELYDIINSKDKTFYKIQNLKNFI